MTKEERTARPVRATKAEWDVIDAARNGQSVQEFMLSTALAVARGELVPKGRPGKAKAKPVASAKQPSIDPQRWNRVRSLAPRDVPAPRPKDNE